MSKVWLHPYARAISGPAYEIKQHYRNAKLSFPDPLLICFEISSSHATGNNINNNQQNVGVKHCGEYSFVLFIVHFSLTSYIVYARADFIAEKVSIMFGD
jgi:hypothetical protein